MANQSVNRPGGITSTAVDFLVGPPAATLPAVRHFIESVSSVKVYFLVEGETPTRYSGEELGSKISSETGATEDEVKTLLYSLAPGDHDVAARSPVVFQVS